MQKSSIAKYSLSVALFILLVAIVFIPSRFPAQSQGSFTPTPTTAPTPETIESDFEYVSQAGQWTSQAASSASGGSYLYSGGSVDDTLTLEFEGTRVTVIYVEGPSLGTFAIEIDNTVVRTVITTSSTTNYNVQAVVDYLASDRHTLKVYPTEGVIAVDAFNAIVDVPQLDLTSQTPPPTEGEGGASGAENGPEGGVWADWAEPNFDFDAVYAPTSGCPDPEDLITRDVLLAGELYAEVDTGSDFISAINRANDNQTQLPFLICITTLSPITLTSPLVINKSINIYGQIGLANLIVSTGFGSSPLFTINTGALVEISHLTIDTSNRSTNNPVVAGGAIVNHGKLSIFDSQLSGNKAFTSGGAIVNSGSLYVARTMLNGNYTLRDTYFEGSGGGAVHNDWGGVFIAHCDEFTDNHAYTAGAAILNGFHNRYSSILHIWRTAFSGNMLGNGYYYHTYGDILNGPIGYTNSNESNAHYSSYIRADGVEIFNVSYTNPLDDSGCDPHSPPRQTQEEPFCVVKVNSFISINAYLSPVPARTERIQYPDTTAATIRDENGSIMPIDRENRQDVFEANIQLRVEGYYSEESYVYRVTGINRNPEFQDDPSLADEYDPDDTNWVLFSGAEDENGDPLYTYDELWINVYEGDRSPVARISAVENGGNCATLEGDLPASSTWNTRFQKIETLRDYGVEIRDEGPEATQFWSDSELGLIETAITKTAQALSKFTGSGSILSFRTAFIENDTVMTEYSIPYILFLRGPNREGIAPADNCKIKTQGETTTPRTIVCRGVKDEAGGLTSYTLVHELGHIFQGRTVTLLGGYSASANEMVNKAGLRDCEETPLMGSFNGVFLRGLDGWGSSEPDGTATTFQQNTDRTPDETSADMFLNVVYRLTSDTLPSFDIEEACDYDAEGSWSGFKNVDVSEQLLEETLPGNRRYWWMYGALNIILQGLGS